MNKDAPATSRNYLEQCQNFLHSTPRATTCASNGEKAPGGARWSRRRYDQVGLWGWTASPSVLFVGKYTNKLNGKDEEEREQTLTAPTLLSDQCSPVMTPALSSSSGIIFSWHLRRIFVGIVDGYGILYKCHDFFKFWLTNLHIAATLGHRQGCNTSILGLLWVRVCFSSYCPRLRMKELSLTSALWSTLAASSAGT